MSARFSKVQLEGKSSYRVYLDRAGEFYETMQSAQRLERWSAVGLNAVHCAISVNDALSVFFLKKRSVGDDHRSAVDLLAQIVVDDVGNQITNYKRILAKKNAVAYEGREFKQSEALEVFKQTERFYQWAIKHLPV